MNPPVFSSAFLASLLRRSGADAAYLYRFENAGSWACLLASLPDAVESELTVVEGRTAYEHYGRTSPLILHREAWTDVRFGNFPEFWTHRYEGVVSIPLLHEERVLGLLNLCRTRPASLTAPQLELVLGLSLPLGALLAAAAENESLRQQLERTSQRLADRKLLDRAKGLLQAHFSWTEEQAYLRLRRESRQRRTAMREVAQEIIERGTLHLTEAHHAR